MLGADGRPVLAARMTSLPEMSIVIGAFFGVKFLNETGARPRLWAATAMVLGVVALALG